MGEAFLRRRGSAKYAEIHATYPAGLVCTCTSGTKVLTAENTSGTWTFYVPSAGTWTVKAGKFSDTVSITARHQSKSVVLPKPKYLITGGVITQGITFAGPITPGQSEGYAIIDAGATNYVYARISDITDYTKLHGTCCANNQYGMGMAITNINAELLDLIDISAAEFREYTVDIRTGAAYVSFNGYGLVRDLWLE